MKHFLAKILIGLALVTAPFSVQAARTDALWDYIQGGNYTKPNGSPSGTNLLIYGSDKYVNFGVVTGTNGYGFRDNSGTIQWKNSGGSWQNIGTGGTGGAQTPWTSDIDGAGFTLSNAYLTATATTLDLSGVTNSLVYANGIGRLGAIATTSLGLPTFSSLSSYLTLSDWYATNTDALHEGSTNLYYTNPRVQTYLDTLSKGYFFSTTSADTWESTKSRWSTTSADYWDSTKSRWSTTSNTYWLTQQTTDVLAQGSTNKYFANSLVDTWLGTKNLGVFWSTTSADHWYTLQNKASTTLLGDANIWSTLQDFSAGITTSDVNTNSFTSHDFANTFFEFTNAGASLNLPSTSNYLTLKNSTDSGIVNLRMENLTGAHDIYFPDQGGTFAMLSDITNASSTLYADNGTFSGLNTFADISFTNATGSNVTSSVFCLIGDTCISTWPTGGSGSGVGTVGTSTSEFSGAIPFFSTNGGYPALLSSDSNFQWDGTNRMLTIGSGGGNFTFQNNAGGSLMVQGSGIFENQTTGGFLTQEPLSVVDNLGSGYIGSIHTDLMSGHHSYYLPDNDGTLALLSDISGATASSTLHADFNTFSGDNTFSATSTIPKIFGSAGYHIDPLGYQTNDYSLLIYGGEASSTVAGGSKHGNSIQISGGFPEGMQEDVDGNWWSPNCTIGDGCRGGVVNIYGGFGIEHDGGGLYMYGGDASSTNPNSGGGIQIGGGSGYNAAHGGYLDMQGGQAFGTGDGGYFDISGGKAETGTGGFFQMRGGFSTFGSGGSLTLSGGEGGSSGGEVLIKGGITDISGNAGNVVLRGGDAFGSGLVGGVVIKTSTLSNVVEFATTTTGTNYFYNPLSIISTASSTFTNGIDISGGCFAINGVCVGGGSSSAVGGSGAIQFANGTAFDGDNATFAWDNTNKKLGVGTSTPYATLSVQGKFGDISDLFVISTTTSSTGESFKLMSMAMNGKVYIHEKKATTTKSYTLNDPTSIPSITASNYGAYFSDDLTRVLECGTAAASNIQLRNGGFANASQQYVGTTAQTITWTKLYNSVVVGRGCITYGGYHYVLYASTTNAASTAIRRSIAADWNNIAADSNWATATISGVALPTTAFLVGAEGGNIYIASTTNAVQKYIIATSTNTLTSSTYIPLSGANVLINNTRVNNNGIYVGFSSAPFTRKYTLSGTAVSNATNIGAAVPSTTGPDMFVTESSLYGLYGNSTTLLTRIIGY